MKNNLRDARCAEDKAEIENPAPEITMIMSEAGISVEA